MLRDVFSPRLVKKFKDQVKCALQDDGGKSKKTFKATRIARAEVTATVVIAAKTSPKSQSLGCLV